MDRVKRCTSRGLPTGGCIIWNCTCAIIRIFVRFLFCTWKGWRGDLFTRKLIARIVENFFRFFFFKFYDIWAPTCFRKESRYMTHCTLQKHHAHTSSSLFYLFIYFLSTGRGSSGVERKDIFTAGVVGMNSVGGWWGGGWCGDMPP